MYTRTHSPHTRQFEDPHVCALTNEYRKTEDPSAHASFRGPIYVCALTNEDQKSRDGDHVTEIKCIYTGAYNQRHLPLGVIGGSKTDIPRFVKCGPGLSFLPKFGLVF